MIIRSVKLENFGPFYGQHEVELSVEETAPIILVHGENMRGKTSFLNAVKWCLYGRVFDRRGREIPAFRFINYDAMDNNDYHMSVTVDYDHNGHRFRLERQVQATYRPTADDALRSALFLRRDGHILPTEQISEIVGDMLHVDIARFFLFDGEMLGHFEVLLSEPGREAALVKESIEQILGLPALYRMVGDLEYLRGDAEKRQLKAVRAARKNEELVAKAQQVSNELDAANKDLERLKNQMADIEKEQDELRQQLDSFSEIKADIREIEKIEQIISEKEEEVKDLRDECRQILSSFWWMPVAIRADELLNQFTAQARDETTRMERVGILRYEIGHFRNAVAKNDCPVCEQQIPSNILERITERLTDAETELHNLDKETEQLSEAISIINKLRPFADHTSLVQFRDKEVKIRKLEIEIRRHQRRLEVIRERLRGHDIRAIRKTEEKYERCIIQVEEISKDIENKEIHRAQLQADLSRLNQEIQRLPGADPRTAAETAIYGGLESIFRGAVDQFREAVRRDVEQEATAIFRSLTTEGGYDRLVINEQYGLSIVDADGRNIRDRSAGAEQIVALSLIGALSRCAVREGPVIMDTPFGRLDVLHRKNILEFVTSMRPQVVLLVQSGEFDRGRDLVHLRGYIGREYQLVRNGSPTRSRFEPLPLDT